MPRRKTGSRTRKAQERLHMRDNSRGGRPSGLDNPKIVEQVLWEAMLGKTPSEASARVRMNSHTVPEWLNQGLARIEEGMDNSDKYVRFYYDWHAAKEEGKSAVLMALAKHKSPQGLVEWLKRTDREQQYLDQDKKYQTDNRPSLIDLSIQQNTLTGDAQVGLMRAKERLAADREKKALDRADENIVEGEVIDADNC